MKDIYQLWIILCILSCFSPIECQTMSILENTINWFTAFHTCRMLHGRLPGVNISNYRLELQDRSVTKNISSPFWIGATYDFLDINSVEPRYATNEFSAERTTSNYVLWHEAFQECQKRNLRLPTRENAQFLDKVTIHVGAFWLDAIIQINFNPDIGIQNRNCLHSLMGSIHEGNCYNTSMTTVCIFDSEPNIDTPSTNTENPSKAGSLQTKTSEAKYIKSTSKSTESMQFQTITNGTIAMLPSIHATFTNSAQMATDEERVIYNRFLFWGIVAALSILLTVSTIIIIILAIKLRQARRQIIDVLKKEHVSLQQLADVDSYQTLDQRSSDYRNGYDTLTHNTPSKHENI